MREIGANGADASLDAEGQQLASDESGMRAAAMSYEFTVRLPGGAQRVIVAANRTSWRLGERVIVIDGTSSLQR
jgi:hypothetical protein